MTSLEAGFLGMKFYTNTNFEMVKEFHEKFAHPVRAISDGPKLITDETLKSLRLDLIAEEFAELQYAVEAGDIIEIADALTDLLYVVYGAGHCYGIDLDACFEEVHASNMSKLGEDGKPIYRDDGKVLKGPNFKLPDLRKVLFPEPEEEPKDADVESEQAGISTVTET
jgi:predicted HAD superfamily Cof-like phosphohydrolase